MHGKSMRLETKIKFIFLKLYFWVKKWTILECFLLWCLFYAQPPGLEQISVMKTCARSFATWSLGKYQVDQLPKWEVKQIKQLFGMHKNFLNASAYSGNPEELKFIYGSSKNISYWCEIKPCEWWGQWLSNVDCHLTNLKEKCKALSPLPRRGRPRW